jgi:hypothetical protein
MLSACKAITIGKSEPQLRFLEKVARRCGFALIEGTGTGDIPTPKSLISFVLVHHLVGEDILRGVISAIRGGGDDVRFSPIIVLADDCEFETILHYVHMGVDDVISLPEKRDVLIARLAAQLMEEHLYLETADYFGPDRRRLEGGVNDNRRTGTSGHSRLYIRRFPDAGTRIMRHQIFAPASSPAHAGVR